MSWDDDYQTGDDPSDESAHDVGGFAQDDEEDGGWMTHAEDSDDLWDSTDDDADVDEEGG